MALDTEKLLEQQNKERKRDEARIAQMRQWDIPKDRWIFQLNFIYVVVAMEMRYILADFFNYQQLDPGRPLGRGYVMQYIFIFISYMFLLGPKSKDHQTWKNYWKPVQYSIALAAYLISTYLLYRDPPREFNEAQITQLFFLTALIVDFILLLAFFIHTYFLFRQKYLPDCDFYKSVMNKKQAYIFAFIIIAILATPVWFGLYVAPDLPKFFH